MRYLGIDYGKKRMGIAASDERGVVAFPRAVFTATSDRARIREVLRALRRENAGAVVLGLPIDMRGRELASAKAVRAFREKLLRESSVPVFLENELLTTRLARTGSCAASVDAAAAALILQAFLDREEGVSPYRSSL